MGNRFWGAFGLKEPEENGGKEQEVAAPAAPNANADGEKELEVAATGTAGAGQLAGAQQEERSASPDARQGEDNATAEKPLNTEGLTHLADPPTTGVSDAETGEIPQESATAPQSAQQRHAQAAERRARELQQAQEAARKTAVAEFLATVNVRDPQNGNKPVKTLEEFNAYVSGQKTAQLNRAVKNGELTPELLEAAVLQSPKIKKLLESVNEERVAAQQSTQQAQTVQYQANMQRQLAEIKRLNPAVNSIDDIIRMETGPEFARLMRTGLAPAEAYKLANHEALVSAARTAAEQALRNAQAGKAHLQPTAAAAGTAQTEVSSVTLERYRRFYPGITREKVAQIEARIKNSG